MECDPIKTKSSFPNQIDDLLFFQDIKLSKADCIPKFQKQLADKNYSEASQILKDSGAFYYGSDLFNYMEDMQYRLQSYLKTHPKTNPHVFSNKKPINAANGLMWISSEPEVTKNIWIDFSSDTWNQINNTKWNKFEEE